MNLKSLLISITMLLSSLSCNLALASFDQDKCDILLKETADIIKEHEVPGLAIAIVNEDQIICRKFYGEKIAQDTIFPIASLSKVFMGSLLSIMFDQNQFNWDSKVSSEIKYFKIKNKNYSDQLNFHHIASMQTGLPEFAGREFLSNSNNRSEIIESFAKIDSIYPPGEGKFSYQYALMSIFEEMIKKRTGYEWEKLLQKKILDPLKLVNTGVDIHSLNDKRNIAICYDHTNKRMDWEQFRISSAAGMYSSLNDLAKWTRLHIRNGNIDGKQLISKSEIAKMRKNYAKIEDYNHFNLTEEQAPNLSYGRFWKNYQYKSGDNLVKITEHNGVSLCSSAIITYIEDKKIGLVILSNKLSYAPSLIRNKFLHLVMEK